MIWYVGFVVWSVLSNLTFAYFILKYHRQKWLLRRSYDALEPLANNFGHWFAGISKADLDKPCTFSPITWNDALVAYKIQKEIEKADSR